MYITVGRKDIEIGPRSRLVFSTTVVVLAHLLVLWGFAMMRTVPYDLPYKEDDTPISVDLYEIPPPPPIQQPQPVIDLVPRHIDVPRPQQTPARTEAAAANPAPVPAPQPQPAPQIAVRAQTDDVDIEKPAPLTRAQQAALADSTVRAQVVQTLGKTKKRDDDEGLQKPASAADAQALNDLSLHQAANAPAMLDASVAPSGLNAPSGAQANAGGKPGGAPGGGGGGITIGPDGFIGKGVKGRGSLTQAMQNHDYCNTTVVKGKTPPPNCDMADLNGRGNLGLIDRPDLKKAAAQRDANLKYKTTPGNSDYWGRVNGSVSPKWQPDDQSRKGAYSDPKDQRVMNGGNTDPKSGN